MGAAEIYFCLWTVVRNDKAGEGLGARQDARLGGGEAEGNMQWVELGKVQFQRPFISSVSRRAAIMLGCLFRSSVNGKRTQVRRAGEHYPLPGLYLLSGGTPTDTVRQLSAALVRAIYLEKGYKRLRTPERAVLLSSLPFHTGPRLALAPLPLAVSEQ